MEACVVLFDEHPLDLQPGPCGAGASARPTSTTYSPLSGLF